MKELCLDALRDSVAMIPFLFAIYFLVEFFERRFSEAIKHDLQKVTKAGPAIGALFGIVPQCGFSVVASALYARRLITKGTLLAVFLTTSDEAVPVLLAQPDKSGVVIRILITKLLIGLVFGYLIDLFIGVFRRPQSADESAHGHSGEIHDAGCCQHDLTGKVSKWQWLMHPAIHTAKIFVFILAVTLGINFMIAWVGQENLGKFLLKQSLLQPFLSALVGLIPNCAASVAITQVFLKGGLSYGAAIAGLCSSAGLGILVLFKENHDRADTIRILLLLLGISTGVGIAIQFFYG